MQRVLSGVQPSGSLHLGNLVGALENYVKLQGKEASQMVKLMEVLDEHDDVKQVWSNFDIEEKEIEAYNAYVSPWEIERYLGRY